MPALDRIRPRQVCERELDVLQSVAGGELVALVVRLAKENQGAGGDDNATGFGGEVGKIEGIVQTQRQTDLRAGRNLGCARKVEVRKTGPVRGMTFVDDGGAVGQPADESREVAGFPGHLDIRVLGQRRRSLDDARVRLRRRCFIGRLGRRRRLLGRGWLSRWRLGRPLLSAAQRNT